MADYTITITNQINVFGTEPTNKWGIFSWGENWGIGDQDMQTDVGKVIVNTTNLSDTIIKAVDTTIENGLFVTTDMSSETIKQNGWSLKFQGNTTEGENRIFTSYATLTAASVSYTTQAATSTTWTVT